MVPSIVVDEHRVSILDLHIDDASLARLLVAESPERRVELLTTVIETGVRGVLSMGIGVDLSEVDQRVRDTVTGATGAAEEAVRSLLDQAHEAVAATLDPDHRQSVMARAFSEFAEWREAFLAQVDPERPDGHAGRLLDRLSDLLGPEGALERRLAEALDPDTDGSALALLTTTIDRRFGELRELMAEERGRRSEADLGTRKGFEYEDQLEDVLREASRPLGAVVERTSCSAGLTGRDSLVGDFTVTLPGGQRVAVEAKHTKSISLTGAEGILAELDRAMANRSAAAAICVSKNEAFPAEVGPFGVYGNRILVVDDGEGTLLRVALRWAQLLVGSSERNPTSVDLDAAVERLDRIRQLTQLFKTNRRALTNITSSIEMVRSSLDGMRSDLLELVEDIDRALNVGEPASVMSLPQHATG